NIDKKEVLRYLGTKGKEEDFDIVDSCIDECKEIADYRVTYREYCLEEYNDRLSILGTKKFLNGISIKRHLKRCHKVILLGVTLGHEIERAINKYEKIDLLKALILDACATAAIEEVCNEIGEAIKEKFEGRNEFIRERFSPGYGDFSIEFQKDFLELIDGQRAIGLNLTESNILIPRKSVTAIIGVSKYKSSEVFIRICAKCSFYTKCNYRKGGKKCYD
ncbi:vitamin B12 dependent-methionine synthase activation domain-containing protein, partial [Clostridium perfringens]